MNRAGNVKVDAGPADGDLAVLERLAQHLEHVAAELGQLVEEEHAVVRQRHLAGPRDGAAADQAGVGDGVVRRAERPGRDERPVRARSAADRVDPRRLERLVERQRRQDGRQPLGEHRLARAGRADHQDVVAAGRGDLERALGVLLAVDLGEVDVVLTAAWREERRDVDVRRLDGASCRSGSRPSGRASRRR